MTNDVSIQAIYTNLNDIQSKIASNCESIAKLQSKIELATPQQISNILIDINNLKHQTSTLTTNLNNLNNKLTQLYGKFNQATIKINEVSNKCKAIEQSLKDSSNKFFSWPTLKQILIGIIIAIILSAGGNITSNLWQWYIQKQSAKYNNPQIRVITEPNQESPNNSK